MAQRFTNLVSFTGFKTQVCCLSVATLQSLLTQWKVLCPYIWRQMAWRDFKTIAARFVQKVDIPVLIPLYFADQRFLGILLSYMEWSPNKNLETCRFFSEKGNSTTLLTKIQTLVWRLGCGLQIVSLPSSGQNCFYNSSSRCHN